MTESFYEKIAYARQDELSADRRQLFAYDSPEYCREISEAAKKLYADGHELVALSLAKEVSVSALTSEVLVGLADHAYWNFDMWASSDEQPFPVRNRRDYYYKMLEGATLELHKRRFTGDKVAKEADWAIESRYIHASSLISRLDQAMDMMLEVPEGKLSFRAAGATIAKMFQLAVIGEGGQEAKDEVYDKVMEKMDSEKMRNIIYTYYKKVKSAEGEEERASAMLPAVLLLMWYDAQGDYVEARNFLEDSKMGDDMRKHLDDNIAAAGVCTQIANATIGAAVFTSLCIGLYSFTIHAATGTDAANGAKFFAWHTVPAVLVGLVLFHAITDSDSPGMPGRAWLLTKIWWLFLFFALPLFPIATSFFASVIFFFVSLYAYPRYRGWA